MVAASSYPFLDVMWTLFVFTGCVMFIWLVIMLLADNFRRQDHSGWAKAAWTLLIMFLPIVGALAYMISRPKVTPEDAQIMARQEAALSAYDQQPSKAQQLAALNDLRANGAITDAEYEDLKRRTLVVT